jgi:CRP/FNR family transcriptional regulator, cyclic AMP receptor protein
MSRTKPDKIYYLTHMDLFRDLAGRELEELDRIITMTAVQKGKVFYRPGEMGEVLFLLKKGHVQLYRLSIEGKKLIIDTLAPGSIFGEMSVVGQRLYNTFAEAIEDCLICVMSRADVERLILDQPKVGLRVLEITGRRLREAEARLEDMAFKGVPARLASLLVRLASEHGDVIEGKTHQELAETVGTYRETATQILNEFEDRGLITIGRKRIAILDLEPLRAIAEGI